MVLRRALIVSVLAVSGLACQRVALVEAPRGPEPATLLPPFHIAWNAYNVETSQSQEYGTRLEYSVRAVPQELLQDLLQRVPGDWEAVKQPGLDSWQSGVNLVRGKPMSQSIFSAAFRNQDGELFVLSVAHDVRSRHDKKTAVGVLMVRCLASAVPEALSGIESGDHVDAWSATPAPSSSNVR